jgi:hypothetical protein
MLTGRLSSLPECTPVCRIGLRRYAVLKHQRIGIVALLVSLSCMLRTSEAQSPVGVYVNQSSTGQMVRTPACHARGRSFESCRPTYDLLTAKPRLLSQFGLQSCVGHALIKKHLLGTVMKALPMAINRKPTTPTARFGTIRNREEELPDPIGPRFQTSLLAKLQQ